MNIKTEGSPSKKSLQIQIKLTSYCNQKCSYCCEKQGIQFKQRESFDLKQLDFLKQLKSETCLYIYGGEPSTILNFEEFINEMNYLLENNHISSVNFLTNGRFDVDYINSLYIHNGFLFLISLHSEFSPELIYKKCKKIRHRKHFRFPITDDLDYLIFAKKVLNEYLKSDIQLLYGENFKGYKNKEIISFLTQNHQAKNVRNIDEEVISFGSICYPFIELRENKLIANCGLFKYDTKDYNKLLEKYPKGFICPFKNCSQCGATNLNITETEITRRFKEKCKTI